MKISKRRLDEIYHTLYSDCFPQHSYKFYKKLNQKKNVFFFSVSYEPNDNFQYITRFRKKKPYQTKPKKLHVSI
jgi:hypothetical protein